MQPGLTEAELKARQKEVVADPYFLKYVYDYRKTVENCCRWGICRFVGAHYTMSKDFAKVCPSSGYYLYDAYSLQGRMNVARGLMEGTLTYENSPRLLDVVHACNMCGGCDTMCKLFCNEMEGLRVVEDLRARLVEDGQLLPQHLPVVEHLRKEDNMMMAPKEERGCWAEGLSVKRLPGEKSEVLYHAGCRFSFEKEQREAPRRAVTLLRDLGVDVGIMGKDESCCGGRAYEMGYRGEFTKFAESNIEMWTGLGIKTVVTSCSDCYHAFKRRYADMLKGKIEVLHVVELLDRLIKRGRLKPRNRLDLAVTYHDPCHLGRRADVYTPGKPIEGVFDQPRDVIRSIPGVSLTEMERIREYSWCCGAGCRVREDYPDFSAWTASERIKEARATGAEAIITACGWCEKNLREAAREAGDDIKVLDVVELLSHAVR